MLNVFQSKHINVEYISVKSYEYISIKGYIYEYVYQSCFQTYINHDEASGLQGVATDGIKEDLCLKTDVNLHCWKKMLVLSDELN